MGTSILFLGSWLVLGVVVTAASSVVYSKAGFDDWGNYVAFGPFVAMLLVSSLYGAGLLSGLLVTLSAVLVLVSFFGTLFLLAVRRWPDVQLKEGALS